MKGRNSFFFAAIGLIACGVALVGGDIVLDRRRAFDQTFRDLENIARIADEMAAGSLRAVDLTLQDAVREASYGEGPDHDEGHAAALRSYMVTRAAAFPEINHLSLTDERGIITSSTFDALLGFDGSDRPYYTGLLRSANRNALFIAGPTVTTSGTPVIFVSRARAGEGEPWKGAVIASLHPSYFTNTLESLRFARDVYVTLIGPDERIMARAPHDDALVGRSEERRVGKEC